MKTTERYSSFFGISILVLLLHSCSVSKQIQKQAHTILLQDTVINTGHIGISIFEPATNTYWYNYNAEKYFVPASNTKLFTLYAGMKYLGDSLVGLRYKDTDTTTTIFSSGDPTLLHPDFVKQPVAEFLRKQKNKKEIFLSGDIRSPIESLGKGWAWDDYTEKYMAERSPLPMYGGLISFKVVQPSRIQIIPNYFHSKIHWLVVSDMPVFHLLKNTGTNDFTLIKGIGENTSKQIPFNTDVETIIGLLEDTFHLPINKSSFSSPLLKDSSVLNKTGIRIRMEFDDSNGKNIKIIHSQPTDSLFTLMMHNSDNFFAEQTLLMVSNEHLGYMNDEAIIDSLLQNDLKDVPQKPNWVDGCGLSRYNLFTPKSFVYILNKMKNEFGLQRLKTILPTGGQGTLKNYYNSDSGFIYAKTGSLSNQIALSGFLITNKNKLLTFSILCNNAIGDGWVVRRAIERFLKGIRQKY